MIARIAQWYLPSAFLQASFAGRLADIQAHTGRMGSGRAPVPASVGPPGKARCAR
jgi:hypothetical protein